MAEVAERVKAFIVWLASSTARNSFAADGLNCDLAVQLRNLRGWFTCRDAESDDDAVDVEPPTGMMTWAEEHADVTQRGRDYVE